MSIHKHKRIILVTGSSRGIGRAIAVRLAGEGVQLVVHYLSCQREAEETARLCRNKGADVLLAQADLARVDEIDQLFTRIEEEFGSVTILVNNAGISLYGLVQDYSEADFDRLFSVNMKSVFFCSQRAIPAMVSQKWGRIVNISSMWGKEGAANESLYAASKGAIDAFTKSCAKELVYSGITVNALAPGAVDTDMMQELSETNREALRKELPLGEMASPQEIASYVAWMVDEEARNLTGQIISPNGGLVY